MFSGEDKFYISSFMCLHLKFAISELITINTKKNTHDYNSKLAVHFIGNDRIENETVEVNIKNTMESNINISFEKWF